MLQVCLTYVEGKEQIMQVQVLCQTDDSSILEMFHFV